MKVEDKIILFIIALFSVVLYAWLLKKKKDDNTFAKIRGADTDQEKGHLVASLITVELGTNKNKAWYQGLTENEKKVVKIIKSNLDIFKHIEAAYPMLSSGAASLKTDLEKYMDESELNEIYRALYKIDINY